MGELEFKIGETYKTRAGHKVMLLDKDKSGDLYFFHFYDETDRWHRPDGVYGKDHELHSGLDVVEEYKEPREFEVWVEIIQNTDGSVYSYSNDTQEEFAGCVGNRNRVIATKRITIREGEFIDE